MACRKTQVDGNLHFRVAECAVRRTETRPLQTAWRSAGGDPFLLAVIREFRGPLPGRSPCVEAAPGHQAGPDHRPQRIRQHRLFARALRLPDYQLLRVVLPSARDGYGFSSGFSSERSRDAPGPCAKCDAPSRPQHLHCRILAHCLAALAVPDRIPAENRDAV